MDYAVGNSEKFGEGEKKGSLTIKIQISLSFLISSSSNLSNLISSNFLLFSPSYTELLSIA